MNIYIYVYYIHNCTIYSKHQFDRSILVHGGTIFIPYDKVSSTAKGGTPK